MKATAIAVAKLLGCLLTVILAVAMVRDTAYNGWDFQVFYGAANFFLEGKSPYSFNTGNWWVFKYPPWCAFLFTPFALGSETLGKWLWGLFQTALFFLTALRLRQAAGFKPLSLFIAFLVSWPVIAFHSLAGQWMMIPLCLSVLAATVSDSQKKWVAPFAGWALSAKIFTLTALIPELRRLFTLRKPKFAHEWTVSVLLGVLLVVVPTGIVSFATHQSPQVLISQWRENAASAGKSAQEDDAVRNRRNQGLPAVLMRAFQVPSSNVNADLVAFLFCLLVVVGIWFRYSKHLNFLESSLIWLGLSVALHPLAWAHSFVFAFPLIALAAERTFGGAKSRLDRYCLGFGLCAFGFALAHRNMLGAVGEGLELASVKALSVLGFSWIVVLKASRGAKA